MKKTKETKLAISTKSKWQEQEVLQWEVVSWDNIDRWKWAIKFNDEVQVISWFYKSKIWKVIGRKGVVMWEKVVFVFKVLLDSIDLIEVFEKELKVLSE